MATSFWKIALGVGCGIFLALVGVFFACSLLVGGAMVESTREQEAARSKLVLTVTSCVREYGYLKMEGSIRNRGDRPVHFVTVETSWKDRGGQVVDTGWTYAVGSEHLRPGDESTFRDSTQHSDATQCEARLKDIQLAD